MNWKNFQITQASAAILSLPFKTASNSTSELPLIHILLTIFILGTALTACSTAELGTRMGSDPGIGENLQLPTGAYGVEYFQISKPMRIRPPNDYSFFFKHCNLLGRRPYYSHSEYGCTPPP